MPKQFGGEIKLDIRDSTPDLDAFLPGTDDACVDVERHLAAALARD